MKSFVEFLTTGSLIATGEILPLIKIVMKLWQCDWVPSSVADWLCRELDDRGIPGTTYTHTLLSLLHPYFCPHPVPKDPGHLTKGFINFECVKSILNSGQPQQEFEVLFEELEDHVHPDADFPELKVSEILKEGNRRSKKRQKRKLNQLSLAPEKIWKVAALQCLWTASDEPHDLEIVIEELFLRLSNSKSASDKESISFDLLIEEDKTQGCYSSNFPPLLLKKNEKESSEVEESALNWKSLIKDKLSPEKQAAELIPIKECQLSAGVTGDNSIDTKYAFKSISIDTIEQAKKDNLEMEIKAESIENGELENKAYCFIPIVRGENSVFGSKMHLQDIDINAGDGNVFESLESQVHDTVDPEEKGKMEEWECAGSLLAEPVNRAVSVDALGNRLYERSLVTTEDMKSNSNTDLNNIQCQNDENIHEANVQNSGASFWSFPSESWKKPQIESVWEQAATFPSQSYKDSIGQLNAELPPVTRNKSEENYIEDKNNFEIVQTKNRFADNWSSRQNWNSYSLINEISPKIDNVFNSQNIFEEEVSENRKVSAPPRIVNENLKNIWSDLNDNITVVNTDIVNNESLVLSPTLIDFQEEDKTEEILCSSFKQFGLKHLWEDAFLSENVTKELLVADNFGSESSLINDSSKILENRSFIEEEEEKYLHHKQTDDEYLLHKIPCGPSGPYVELRHTESSGFTAVIPQDKNIPALSEDSSLNEELLDNTPKEIQELASDNNLTAQEEENLLTSPRTHFRPIRQDSHGSVDESKIEDGQGILNVVNKIKDPNLIFQRSGSGTLYLESDLLTGSPKKYMAYREPAKIVGVINPNEVQNCPAVGHSEESPSTVFVPKFKLINNEKFCQTEGPEGSARLCENINQELESSILQNELKKYDYLFKDTDKNWEESYPNNMKLIWEENPRSNFKEAWELELSGPSETRYPKWSTHDFSQTNWSNKQVVQLPPMQEPMNKTSFKEPVKEPKSQVISNEEDKLSKIKFIWHSPKGSSNPVAIGGKHVSDTSLKNSVEFPSSVIFPESWNDKHMQQASCLQTESTASGVGLVIPKSPWNIETTNEDDMNKSSKRDESVEDDASRWQLQWEVDQEADEILGGLLPPSPLKSSPPYSPLKNPGPHIDLEEFNFLDFLEGQDQQPPIEDLDNLEPGWDLNEGFEWGPAAEELFMGDDDDGTEDMLVYENEDGQTVLLPVHYLENSLYDQIFGSVDTPIGGSLPDLPGSEFKKGSLSLKVSRRSRGEKFVPPSRRPCSFFLEGNCRRSDCKFSHDLLTITCRFWEEGSCLKGDTCPFRHGFPPPTSRRRNRSEGDQSSLIAPVTFASLKEGNSLGGSKSRPIPRKNRGNTPSVSSFELDSEADFPCLGSSVESKIGSFEEQSFPNLKVTKLSKKKKKFITVSKCLFSEVENECEKGIVSKRGGGRRSKGVRSISIDLLSLATDGCGGAHEAGPSSKKKGKDNNKECESLRKVLRKRFPVPPPPPFSHEDGTLSDF